jgi:prophage regulatory protein
MGAHEIRIRLGGVSRQRAYQITSRADFPKPVADLAQGKVWATDDVEAWMKVHRRDIDEPDDWHRAITIRLQRHARPPTWQSHR